MTTERTWSQSLVLMTAALLSLFLFMGPSMAVDADVHLETPGPFAPGDDDDYPQFTISIEDSQPGKTYEVDITIDDPDVEHSCTVDLTTDGNVHKKNCDGYNLEVSAFEFCWGYNDNECAQDGLIAWKLPVCQKGGKYKVSMLIKNGDNIHEKEDFEFEVLDPVDPRCFPPEPVCDDGLDNDKDKFIDCDDPDCCGDPACFRFFGADEGAPGPSGVYGMCCVGGGDEDKDGDVDRGDIDCHERPNDNCDDGVDNDGDGKRDCADPDCDKDPACKPKDNCGDGKCNGDETCGTCPEDCGACRGPPDCPDGTCRGGEDCQDCPDDCGACRPQPCGDGECKGVENCQNCVADCGDCPPSECGDDSCAGDETCQSCPEDCGACSSSPDCGDGACAGDETCINCPSDCGPCAPTCGDLACSSYETCINCPSDCGPCATTCGDGECVGETCVSCPSDCGACQILPPGYRPGGGGVGQMAPPLIEDPEKPPNELEDFTFKIWDFWPEGVDPVTALLIAIPATGNMVDIELPTGELIELPVEKVYIDVVDEETGETEHIHTESRVTVPAEVAQGNAGTWKVTYRNPMDPEDLVDEEEVDVMAAGTISPGTGSGPEASTTVIESGTSAFEQYIPFIGILLLIIIVIGLFYARRKGKELVAVKDEDSLEESGEVEEV